MNRPRMRRLVTGLSAIGIITTLGLMAACGGGERPKSAEENEPVTSTDGGPKKEGGAVNSNVTFDVDLAKGIAFGDEGLVSCGAQAADRTFTLKNTGSEIVNYKIELTAGNDYYTVTPTDGAMPAGATATIKVVPNPIPKESEVTTDLYAGTLSVSFPGLGVPPTTIRLHQTARGAIITSSAAETIDLGEVQVGKSNAVPLTLTNAGNAEVTANLKVGTSIFTVGGNASDVIKLTGGASESTEIKLAPTSAGDLTDTLVLSYGSAVFCKEPPTTIALKGAGATSVGISSNTLDFGRVNCNTTANPQVVTISSTVAMTFNAVLTKGGLSPYTLANEVTGAPILSSDAISVPAASSFKLRVVPKKMEQVSPTTENAFGDTLTITTQGVPGDVPHPIVLRQTAQGAILAFDLASVTVTGPVGQNINTNFALQNKGNQAVPYVITTTPLPTAIDPGFTSTLTTGNAVVGDTKGVLISKAPTNKGQVLTGTMSVALGAGGGVLCADLPPPMPLSVTGTGSAITVNPTNLNYGVIICGSTAAPQSFTLAATVENNIKLSLGLGPASPYSFSKDQAGTQPIANNTSVNVKPGSPVVVWVQAKTVTIPTKPGSLNDEITLTSDIPTEDVRKVPLTMSAAGYYFVLPTTVEEGEIITITNSGSTAGKVNVSGPVTPTGPLDLPQSSSISLATTGPGEVTVAPVAGTTTCVSSGKVTVTKAP